MPTGKITKRAIDALEKGAQDVYLWDSERKGFGAKRTPTGKVIYLVQYRMHGGRNAKTRRYTIGPHGTWTPELAGREAERLLIMVAQGIDPFAELERQRKEAVSLAFSTYADQFLESYVKVKWPRAYTFPETAIRLHLKPVLRDTPLPEIGIARLNALFDALPIDKPALRRNTFVVLRRLIRWAKSRGDIASNPLEGFEPPAPVASRDRVLSDIEIKLVWQSSRELHDPFGQFVRLLLLTGQRRNEVADLRWEELDRVGRQWLLPAARAKNGVEVLLPLSDITMAELDSLAGCKTWPTKGYVLTTTGDRPISGFSKAKRLLDEAIARTILSGGKDLDVAPWRFHDLRRTMATSMQRLRISGDVIEACENRIAGRSKSGAARIYQRHDYEPEKREAFDKWATFICTLVQEKPLQRSETARRPKRRHVSAHGSPGMRLAYRNYANLRTRRD